VRTHSGNCVVARRKMPAMAAPPGFPEYYQNYQFPNHQPQTPQN
jgi:hypothetical protein